MPDLRAVAAAVASSAPTQWLDGWTIGAEPSAAALVGLEQTDAGVRVTAPAEAAGVALRRSFQGPVASRGASVRFLITIATDDARALKRALLNLSVCGMIGGRRRTLASLHASAFELSPDGAVVVTLETTWAARATACHVELRFRRGLIDCRLHTIGITVLTIGKRSGVGAPGVVRRDATRFADAVVSGNPDASPIERSPWAIAVLDGDGEAPAVSIDTNGLRADFATAGRSLTLTRNVRLPAGASGRLLRLDLRLRGDDVDVWLALLSQVSISVADTGKSPRSLLRLSPHLTYIESPREVRVVAEAPCLGAVTECVIELTFQRGDAVLTLEAIDLMLLARDAAQPEHPARARAGPLSSPVPSLPTTPMIAVVGWQLADNAVGRAFVLADMLRSRYPTVVVGPLFGAVGTGVWEPLRSADLPMRSFSGGAMRTFVAEAASFANDIHCDVAYVSKPRLPSILLALLIHHRTGCGLVLDIDDHELSFFPGTEGIGIDEAVARIEATGTDRSDDPPAGTFDGERDKNGGVAITALPDEERPDGSLWTAVAETLIATFDDRTVSNAALRNRYGGLIVRHARDETVFRPDAGLRGRIRSEFGIEEGDRVILFMGTPRRHKGLERLAAALERVDDPRLRLVVIGTIADRGMQRDLLAFTRARISLFPNQPWQRLPELSHLADGVCLLQDVDSPITHYQIPAKLTDALALGVPVAATRVAPLADAPSPSVTYVDDDDALDAWLRAIADGAPDPDIAGRRIDWFHEEFSYRVNRARMEASVDRCLTRRHVWKPEWTALFAGLNRCYGAGLPEDMPAWAGGSDGDGEIAAPSIRKRAPVDLVCFWKQNDTGIYGRRHDMLMKYLRESERVNSLLVFDAPIRVEAVQKAAQRGRGAVLEQAKLTSDATIRRFLELDDERDVRRRVFVYGDKPGQCFYGRTLDTLEGYADFVSQQLPMRSASGARRLGWVWPVAPHFAEIAETVGFDDVVVDLVDDERAMARDLGRRTMLDEEYRRSLVRADVIFANCETLRDRFPEFRDTIRVVPNACEILGAPTSGAPNDIAHLSGPVIGYVGNLRARLDVPLIEELARLHPEWSIALVGSAHGSPEVLRLQGLRNVHFTGPRTYEEAQRYIRHFDVAIMPHLRNALSDSMNPLKLYVYVALGKRVVSTRVSNIDELQDYVDIADDGPDFLAKVELAVARARFDGAHRPLSREALWQISWQQRVATILAAIA
jgi:glycosyltransferase involved in cell wall biosynthesis